MGKTSEKFSKERIEDGKIDITMVEEGNETSLVFTLKVENYSKLKKSIFYYKSAVRWYLKWRFELAKAKGTLFAILSTNVHNKTVHFSIDNIDPTKKRASTAKEISDTEQSRDSRNGKKSQSVYVSEFCNKAILDPENKFLANDVLTIKCKYETDSAESSCLLFPLDLFYIDTNADRDYLINLYRTSFWADFTIIVKDDSIKVHKPVLCAHSMYLEEAFTTRSTLHGGCNSREIVVNTSSHIMRRVLIFMYIGELENMNVEGMIEILFVAEELKIPCLVIKILHLSNMRNILSVKNRCIKFLTENLSVKYAWDIFQAGILCKEIGLKNKALHFMYENPDKTYNLRWQNDSRKGIQNI